MIVILALLIIMSSISARRILKDFKVLETEKSHLYKAKPHEDNIYHWRGYLLPPDDSMYLGYIIPFEIIFEDNYPNKPPKVMFPPNLVYHPNFYSDGNICLDILQNRWSNLYDVRSILLSIILLLKEPNPDSPANSEAANLFSKNISEFKKKVREYAFKSWIAQ